jgi:hypothetical protein
MAVKEQNKVGGLGGRGKNIQKHRQGKPTRRKVKLQKIPKANVPGVVESKNPRKRNQKNNQRNWNAERSRRIRKANRVPADV